MTDSTLTFMRDIEDAFRSATGLANRSMYKIFYGPVRHAPILTLGINPGGSPAETSADGTVQAGSLKSSASASYFENGEHDVLDCEWKENTGLRKLLMPFVESDEARFREEIVKTNLAFRRSSKKADIDMGSAIAESMPFLQRIIERISPELILLTGVTMPDFTDRFATDVQSVTPTERDPGVKQVVFSVVRAVVRNLEHQTLIVQVAHASQFSWTYERYDVAQRTLQLLEAEQALARDVRNARA